MSARDWVERATGAPVHGLDYLAGKDDERARIRREIKPECNTLRGIARWCSDPATKKPLLELADRLERALGGDDE